LSPAAGAGAALKSIIPPLPQMHRPVRPAGLAIGLFASAAFLSSCADGGTTKPSTSPAAAVAIGGGPRVMAAVMPAVRISEIHYDNASTDAQEAIEISAPVGENLTGWSVVLYNGSGGASYDTDALTGLSATTCPSGLRKVVVVSYAVNGVQNGAPDGMALVNPSGTVVEFLSYEGAFTATNGPANGLTSVDIGVLETGSEALVDVGGGVLKARSLRRSGADVWSGPGDAANSFGVCNDEDDTTPPPAVVDHVTIDPPASPVVVGGTQTLAAKAFDATNTEIPGKTFEWDSDNKPVATVNAAGVVTGVTEGDATISATAGGKTGTISIHVNPAPPPPTTNPRISEVHYDNTSTDAGERIEIEGPAGMNLNGWSVVLYNLTGGATYNTQALAGTIPASCGSRGVVVLTYGANGIQNGPQDGIALVGPSGVVEFLSYEGTLTATNGAAAGMTSTDIGVSQNPDNSVPAGFSLQRDDAGWFGPEAQSFGACNTRPAQSAATIVINEVMSNPLRAVGGASWGEWFEVHNTGTAPVDLQGWSISSFGHPDHVIASSVVVPAGGFSVLGRGFDPAQNGGITIDYNYFVGSTTIFLDANDRLELRDAAGARVDMVRWTTSPLGMTRALRDAAADNTDVDGANWGFSTVAFGDGDYGTPRAANGTLSNTPPPVPNFITFSGRTGADVPLPVGFQDQVFATLVNGNTGATIPTTFTWANETPGISSVDQDGVLTALAPGTAILRATAADGTTRTHSLQTHTGVFSSASYVGNTEFGEPADANASDDFIVRRPQFTASYNEDRGIPNWVSFNLEATHFGTEDRCDCFTFDPMLPANFRRYTTADYTGGGAFIGPDVGLDRGHLARSFDRTSASLDNAATFYFTNIIPQFAHNNQGPWALLENYLGNLAQNQNKELYVIAGASVVKTPMTTVKNEGKIVIPDFVWKVAVIMPRNQGLANIDSRDDVEIVAVIMPNRTGIRDDPWEMYKKTVDEVEALSGYDLLALLPDQVEIAVESGTRPPTATVNGPFTSSEGESVSMSAAGSSDPDANDVLSYRWNFGDGSPEATGIAASRTYAQNGNYTVTLTVTDSRGLTSRVTTTAHVANVPPVITSFSGAPSAVSGVPYSVAGTFSDPGVQDAPWTAAFSWDDGAPTSNTLLSQAIVASASHTYLSAGTYRVRFTVTDRDGGSDFRETTVSVDRLALSGALDHQSLQVKDNNGNHRISFHLFSTAAFDARSVVTSSARIGSVGVAVKQNQDGLETDLRDVNGDGRADLVLDFYRRELVDTGVLTDATRTLTLTADLTDGRQIVSHALVRPK
jgi:DNA/RNA endonuclease G (NUC1)